MDEQKLGTVALLGNATFKIGVEYSKEHMPNDCMWCRILRSRETLTEYEGITETANALSLVLDYFKYDILYSEMYSHCRAVRVVVFQLMRGKWSSIEEHEIKKG